MSWSRIQEDWRAVRDLVLRGGDASDGSEWLRDALRSALAQNAQDVANDAELLAAILRGRAGDVAGNDGELDLEMVESSVRTCGPSSS